MGMTAPQGSGELSFDLDLRARYFESMLPENRPSAIVTPFSDLNVACRGTAARRGFALGRYIVIGGDTGQGKSLLGLQIATEAHKQGFGCGVISLEMGLSETMARFYSQRLGIEASRLEPGEYYDEAVALEVERWQLDNFRKSQVPFVVADDAGPDLRGVMRDMRAMYDEGVKVFLIDYLQLIEDGDGVGSVREVQKISKALRDFAHRWSVLAIALSQFNNEGGNDRSQSPHVGHLYGGRRISQDSDMTLLLDHSRYEHVLEHPHLARTHLIVPKNRYGPHGFSIPIEWNYRYLTARQALPDEEWKWPKKAQGPKPKR